MVTDGDNSGGKESGGGPGDREGAGPPPVDVDGYMNGCELSELVSQPQAGTAGGGGASASSSSVSSLPVVSGDGLREVRRLAGAAGKGQEAEQLLQRLMFLHHSSGKGAS